VEGALESTRREWEEGNRRLQAAASDRTLYERLLAEVVTGTRERVRDVRVQALEAAGAAACAADAQVELRAQAPLLLVPSRQALGKRGLLAREPTEALDAAVGLEPRDRSREVAAGEPVGRRERLAGLVERRLLGHGGPAERAADRDPKERAGRPP